jgi:hypothetical protein
MADETKTQSDPVQSLPTLAETSGVSQADAAKMIADMRDSFEALKAQNGQLQRQLVAQQAQIMKLSATGNVNGKFGQVEIVMRHCNACGTQVEEGKRCPKHPGTKINEIGMGMKHNRPQPIIVRQV